MITRHPSALQVDALLARRTAARKEKDYDSADALQAAFEDRSNIAHTPLAPFAPLAPLAYPVYPHAPAHTLAWHRVPLDALARCRRSSKTSGCTSTTRSACTAQPGPPRRRSKAPQIVLRPVRIVLRPVRTVSVTRQLVRRPLSVVIACIVRQNCACSRSRFKKRKAVETYCTADMIVSAVMLGSGQRAGAHKAHSTGAS